MSSIQIVPVVYESTADDKESALAARLGVELINESGLGVEMPRFYLKFLSEGLSLCETVSQSAGPTRVDFSDSRLNQRAGDAIKQQNLVKALGLKKNPRPRVLDAMAGLGKDGFLLASVGCSVQMLEKSQIMAALLADGLKRWQEACQEGGGLSLALLEADFLDCEYQKGDFDVVYLDPMYPGSNRKSKAKKDMDRLHHLLGFSLDEPPCFAKAIDVAGRRVIIKRPKNAPNFAQQKPDIVYKGSSARFDVYLLT